MGLLRLLLALSVLVGHAKSPIFGVQLVYGVIAVQSFYLISGFYMALILSQKYVGEAASYRLFITNRLLRLYPTYWAIVGLIILFNIVQHLVDGAGGLSYHFINLIQDGQLALGTFAFLVFANSLIFGQDLISFAELNLVNGTLDFTPNSMTTDNPGYKLLFIPQAWTVGIELWFYLVAPFFVRRSARTLVAVVVGSLAVRFALYSFGLNHDPWTYRFFPTELAFFLGGVLAYRFYTVIKHWEIPRRILQLIFVGMAALTISFYLLPVAFALKQWTYYVLLLIAVPFLFRLTRENPVDRALADLSYPVYLSHIFVIWVLTMLGINGGAFGLIVAIVTIGLSALLVRFVERPVDAVRQGRVLVAQAHYEEASRLSTQTIRP